MEGFPYFSGFILRAEEKDGRTCTNGLPVASPSKQMLGRFPVLLALSHDNLAAYLHFCETIVAQDLVIILQEHHKKTLADVIGTHSFTTDEKNSTILSIVDAMEFLHKEGIMHGNLHLHTVFYIKKDGKTTVKLSEYGLPFLTNYGEDIASPMNDGLCLSPERLVLQDDNPFCDTVFQSDTWAVGIVLLQLYLAVNFDKVVSEVEYSDILNKADTPGADVMEEFFTLLATKNMLHPDPELDWLKPCIQNCLQLDCEKRPQIEEVAAVVHERLGPMRKTEKFETSFKTVEQLREQFKNNAAKSFGFDNTPIQNAFYLWKICGSTPEVILLKRGIIQNHAPISAYPSVLSEDHHHAVTEDDEILDTQSTFQLGVFEMPRTRVQERIETGQEISARPFTRLSSTAENEHHGSILYETSLNMLTLEHLLNATAVYGVDDVDIKVITKVQRQRAWQELLGVTPADWRKFHDLDILAPHSSDRQLEVDIPRCHQYDSFMTTPAVQEDLRKVLKGWQLLTEEEHFVYWQGCDSLATPFVLANMGKPHIAYACFHKFANKYCHKFYLKDNSEVIKELLGVFYQLVAYLDPVFYKHLKNTGFDAELFAIPWFLTCFAHELPLSKLVLLWDEIMMHDSSFPLMVALAMLMRLRDKLLAVGFNEMIIIIHDQPDLSIEDVIKTAREYSKLIPPSCAFRAHAKKEMESEEDLENLDRYIATSVQEICKLPVMMKGLSLGDFAKYHCPRLSTVEFVVRVKLGLVYAIDTRPVTDFEAGHFNGSYNHPDGVHQADINWLSRIPQISTSTNPKCIIYGENDIEAAVKLAETYVFKGVPNICLLQDPFDIAKEKCPQLISKL